MVYAKLEVFQYKMWQFLFIVWAVSLIISDQEDESMWKILAMKNWLPDIALKTQGIIQQ